MTDPLQDKQQEVRANLVLDDLERQSDLLSAAAKRPPTWLQLVACLLAVASIVAFRNVQETTGTLLAIVLLLCALVGSYNRATHKRIDAMLALLRREQTARGA